jgi:hypothetical protein
MFKPSDKYYRVHESSWSGCDGASKIRASNHHIDMTA